MTRDQFIAEMMGWNKAEGPWIKSTDDPYEALSINTVFYLDDPDFTLPRNAYALQQFVMGAEWWRDFGKDTCMKYMGAKQLHPSDVFFAYIDWAKWLFSNPDRFASLVAEYRGWKEDNG